MLKKNNGVHIPKKGKPDGSLMAKKHQQIPAKGQSGRVCSDDLQPTSGAIGEVYPSGGKQTANGRVIDEAVNVEVSASCQSEQKVSASCQSEHEGLVMQRFKELDADPKYLETLGCFYDFGDDTSEINAIGKIWKKEDGAWIRMRSVMDSGCGQSVIPPTACPTYEISSSPGSRRGQQYMAASKHTIPNLGEQLLNIVTDELKEGKLKYQVADVSRPLNAVSEICDSEVGNRVLFGKNGGVIYNLTSGRETWFGREGGIYIFDFWVKPGPLAEKTVTAESTKGDFPRPG